MQRLTRERPASLLLNACRLLLTPVYVFVFFINFIILLASSADRPFLEELASGRYKGWIWYYQSEVHYLGYAAFMLLWCVLGLLLCFGQGVFRKPKLLLVHGLLTVGHMAWIQLWLRNL